KSSARSRQPNAEITSQRQAMPNLNSSRSNRLSAGSSNESAFRTLAGSDIHRVDASIAEAGAMPGKACAFGNWLRHCGRSRKRCTKAKGQDGIYLRIRRKNRS
ncbi:hypothetical protein, partial [Mesorhizobium sp. M1406]|uniref:hypothetical protein n=1 Tax=Mesorhizobium sp. M1406 TaxID=2957099 RepID=UPI003336F0BF